MTTQSQHFLESFTFRIKPKFIQCRTSWLIKQTVGRGRDEGLRQFNIYKFKKLKRILTTVLIILNSIKFKKESSNEGNAKN